MGSSSIGCGGQNSLEAESLQPNSPLGERINDENNNLDLFAICSSVKAGVHVKTVLTSLNTAFLPISRSRFKQR